MLRKHQTLQHGFTGSQLTIVPFSKVDPLVLPHNTLHASTS